MQSSPVERSLPGMYCSAENVLIAPAYVFQCMTLCKQKGFKRGVLNHRKGEVQRGEPHSGYTFEKTWMGTEAYTKCDKKIPVVTFPANTAFFKMKWHNLENEYSICADDVGNKRHAIQTFNLKHTITLHNLLRVFRPTFVFPQVLLDGSTIGSQPLAA